MWTDSVRSGAQKAELKFPFNCSSLKRLFWAAAWIMTADLKYFQTNHWQKDKNLRNSFGTNKISLLFLFAFLGIKNLSSTHFCHSFRVFDCIASVLISSTSMFRSKVQQCIRSTRINRNCHLPCAATARRLKWMLQLCSNLIVTRD